MYWTSVISGTPSSRDALSDNRQLTTRQVKEVGEIMAEHRKRGVKFSFTRGAGTLEEIGRVASERYTLKVKLLRGDGLLAADNTGFSDPYCDIHVWCPTDVTSWKHTWRSDTVIQNLNPIWDKRDWAPAPLSKTECLLHLVCFDWNRAGTDEFLGESLIDLSKYEVGKAHQLQLQLDQFDPQSTQETPTGHVTIELRIDRR